jgi:hypothetical protein
VSAVAVAKECRSFPLHSLVESANLFPAGTRVPEVPRYGNPELEEFFVNLKPLGDRVVVEHVEQAEKSAGGVFLPDTAKEKPQEGRVLAVGTGRTLSTMARCCR